MAHAESSQALSGQYLACYVVHCIAAYRELWRELGRHVASICVADRPDTCIARGLENRTATKSYNMSAFGSTMPVEVAKP